MLRSSWGIEGEKEMKRSFGNSAGGCCMFNNKAVARAAVTSPATREPYYSSHLLPPLPSPLNSSPSPVSAATPRLPFPSPSPSPPYPHPCDDFEWVSDADADADADQLPSVYYYDHLVFGSVPSQDDVRLALSDLQLALHPSSGSQFSKQNFAFDSDDEVMDAISSPSSIRQVSSISESDWKEPSLQLCTQMGLQNYGSNSVYDAFHLMQNDTSIQRMVLSISSDNAVWNAVLNNEVVRELRELFYMGEKKNKHSRSNGSLEEDEEENGVGSLKRGSEEWNENAAASVLRWILNGAKTKVMQVVEKIIMLLSRLFQGPDHKNCETSTVREATTDPFMPKLTSAFTISVVVLLTVVLTRIRRA